MIRFRAFLLLAAFASIALKGCCAPKVSPQKPCPPYISQQIPIALSDKPQDAGVAADFTSIGRYAEVTRSALDQMASTSLKIDLLETVCLAAGNSVQADLIEAERHALNCQSGERSTCAIDLILQGESLEQRNKSSGSAGEVFLGLVEVQMQRKLLEESKQHLEKLDATLQAASDAQFATATGKNELAKGRIRVNQAESKLNSAEQNLMYRLNVLINTDSVELINFIPVHELTLTDQKLDARTQAEMASFNRPGIRSLETAISNSGGNDAFYKLLGQYNSLLGIRLTPPITNRLLRRKMIQKLGQDEAPDRTIKTRMNQFERVIEGKKQEARIQTNDALLQLQRALENVSIINENIARLAAWRQQLTSKQQIEAQDSFVELNQNWVEMQQAKSDRVSAAIEYETAKIKLLQAQGTLISQCGYDLPAVHGPPVACGCDENTTLPAFSRKHSEKPVSQFWGESD